MANLHLRLSEAELIFVLTTMRVASYPVSNDVDLMAGSTERRQAALQAARAALVARGLARTNANGDVELNPLVVAAVGITVRPEAGYWLSFQATHAQPQAVYYNWTRQLIMRSRTDSEHIFYFDQIADRNALVVDILSHCALPPAASDGPAYTLPLGALQPAMRPDELVASRQATLQSAGLPAGVAAELAQTLSQPEQRASLVAVGNMRQQAAPVGTLGWFVHQQRLWLAIQAAPANEQVVLRQASAASLSQALSVLVDQAIEATPQHPLV